MGHDANNKKQRRSSRSRALPPAAAVSTVLDNDDLLGEVLLRIALPTSLVRAALVCRRWLRVAADPAFLLRFHDRNPSPLLGFYVHSAHLRGVPKFAPMPGLPPELAAGARRAGSALDAFVMETSMARVLYCLDGHLLVRLGPPNSHRDVVLSPMRPAGRPSSGGSPAVVVVPPPPLSASLYDHFTTWLRRRDEFLSSRRGVIVCAAWRRRGDQTISTYELRGGAWHEQHNNTALSSAAPAKTKLPDPTPNRQDKPYFFLRRGDRIYLVSSASVIADLRSASASESEPSHLTFVVLPDGVEYKLWREDKLWGWTDNSVIYLIEIDAKRLQLCVWLYQLDTEAWSLEDTLCLRTLLAGSVVTTTLFPQDRKATHVVIHAVGSRRSTLCVFLQVGADVLHINIKNRTAQKVYTVTPEDGDFVTLAPLNMIFPPVFPVIKDDSDHN